MTLLVHTNRRRRLVEGLLACLLLGCGDGYVNATGGNGDVTGGEGEGSSGGAESASATGNGSCGEPAGDSYWPVRVGAEWTYLETENDGNDAEKIWTLTRRMEDEGFVLESEGQSPRRVDMRIEDGKYYWSRKITLDRDTGEPLQHSYFPPPGRLRLDPELAGEQVLASSEVIVSVTACATAQNPEATIAELESCPDAAKTQAVYTDTWRFDGAKVKSVPAGEFDTICQTRNEVSSEDPGTVVKTYCWARGVGKVFESGNTKDEELQEFCFP